MEQINLIPDDEQFRCAIPLGFLIIITVILLTYLIFFFLQQQTILKELEDSITTEEYFHMGGEGQLVSQQYYQQLINKLESAKEKEEQLKSSKRKHSQSLEKLMQLSDEDQVVIATLNHDGSKISIKMHSPYLKHVGNCIAQIEKADEFDQVSLFNIIHNGENYTVELAVLVMEE